MLDSYLRTTIYLDGHGIDAESFEVIDQNIVRITVGTGLPEQHSSVERDVRTVIQIEDLSCTTYSLTAHSQEDDANLLDPEIITLTFTGGPENRTIRESLRCALDALDKQYIALISLESLVAQTPPKTM